MENNEMMTMEGIDAMNDVVGAEKKSGMGTGLAMLIGAGVTLAVTAGVKLVKKAAQARKSKKDSEKCDDEDLAEVE